MHVLRCSCSRRSCSITQGSAGPAASPGSFLTYERFTSTCTQQVPHSSAFSNVWLESLRHARPVQWFWPDKAIPGTSEQRWWWCLQWWHDHFGFAGFVTEPRDPHNGDATTGQCICIKQRVYISKSDDIAEPLCLTKCKQRVCIKQCCVHFLQPRFDAAKCHGIAERHCRAPLELHCQGFSSFVTALAEGSTKMIAVIVSGKCF